MAFIALDRPETADVWLKRLLGAAANLAHFPDQGRVVPEVGRSEVNEVLVSPYRLIYRRDTNAVTILAVVHERRLLNGEHQ